MPAETSDGSLHRQQVLLTFIGTRDPTWQDDSGTTVPGPVLTLLGERRFDLVYLFFNVAPAWNRRASAMRSACLETGQADAVEFVPLGIVDVTDLLELFRVMNDACQGLLSRHKRQNVEYSIATASGTPAMQTIWVLLAQSQLVPARLLHIAHPQHARSGRPLVNEIKLDLAEFPRIETPDAAEREIGILRAQIESLKTANAVLKARRMSAAGGPTLPPQGVALAELLEQTELAYFHLALAQADGRGSAAARLLGLQPHAFRKRAATFGLWPPKSKQA
jgi:hypothetical protein